MLTKLNNTKSFLLATFCKTLFLVGAGLLFAITLSAFVRPELVDRLKFNISNPSLILCAELIGFISPGPRYVIYPIVAKLADLNLGAAVVIALISGHVLIEPSTSIIEAGLFGFRFPAKRFVISFLLTFLAAIVTLILETRFGLEML